MPAPFLLDTNAYFRFFQVPSTRTSAETAAYDRLKDKVQIASISSFYISEITSMEVHSVLGGYRRGGNPEERKRCERMIVTTGGNVRCSNTWIAPQKNRMTLPVFRNIQRLIGDVETGRGTLQATILNLTPEAVQQARQLLMKYADIYKIGSHDALIAGTLIAARETGISLTLVTTDRGLKNVLNAETLSVYDPAQSTDLVVSL